MQFDKSEKSQQHPKDFPGGHPPQYYPGLAWLNFGVRKGSGAFDAVWPLTIFLFRSMVKRIPCFNYEIRCTLKKTETKKAIRVFESL